MDKEILRQYISIKREIKEEQQRIDRLEHQIADMTPKLQTVSDIVTMGKRGKKSLGNVKISGVGDQTLINRKRAALRERKARKELKMSMLERLVCDVEEYIDAIPDSETRRIMRYFYLDGLTWAQTAVSMGEGYSPESCKKKVQRELRR